MELLICGVQKLKSGAFFPNISMPWARFRKEQSGATAIEYGLILALLALVVVSAFQFLEDPVDGLFGGVGAHFESFNSGEDIIEHYE